MKAISLYILLTVFVIDAFGQGRMIISGKIYDTLTAAPIEKATVSMVGYPGSTISKPDGSFKLAADARADSIIITVVGYQTVTIRLTSNKTNDLKVVMKRQESLLEDVKVGSIKKSGKSFMKTVIDHKSINDPTGYEYYRYQRYVRNELDIDGINFNHAKKNGLKGLVLQTYSGIDSTANGNHELPIYFSETTSSNTHTPHEKIDKENIFRKIKLGLPTDDLLSQFEKFKFHFNVYEDWIGIFDQSYASPLHTNAFKYYQFIETDTLVEDGRTTRVIRFMPLRSYEKSFSGTL